MIQWIHRPLPAGFEGNRPRRIIVHAMGHKIMRSDGRVQYAATYLEEIGLSAHVLVAPDGTPIRCREDDQGAYHALGYNEHSLGIEILMPGEHNLGTLLQAMREPWIEPGSDQWRTAVSVVRAWARRWNIEPVRGQLDPHYRVDPERKEDPGQGFPWGQFVEEVS
jgi:N-acetyl-anhydromuramyl-L-alanine amidase AmpD